MRLTQPDSRNSVLRHKGLKIYRRHGPRKQVALAKVASCCNQQIALPGGLNAFGNHLHAQFMGHHEGVVYFLPYFAICG